MIHNSKFSILNSTFSPDFLPVLKPKETECAPEAKTALA